MSGKPCRQSNVGQCTPLLTWGTSQIAICGEVGCELGCKEIGEHVREIVEECKEADGGRGLVAEGWLLVSGRPGEKGFRSVVVYHS